MKKFAFKALALVAGLALAGTTLAGPIPRLSLVLPDGAGSDGQIWLAQETDGQDGDYGAPDNGRTPVTGSSLNTGTTATLVKIINDANRTCGSDRMEVVYRVDCLRIYYGWVADQIPDRSDYAPIKKIMQQAEAKLDRIVRANLDTAAPVIEPKEGFKKNAKRLPPVRAVKKASVKKVAKQAAAVVQETELAIIRSGGDPARRTPHFNAVAEAVDDNLVILRSA